MSFETFDDLDNLKSTEEVVPFQFREEKTEEGTLEWLNKRFQKVYEGSFQRFIMYRRYIQMYKNVSEEHGDGLTKTNTRYVPGSSKKPKLRDNLIWDLVDQKTAEISKSTTKVAFIPQSYFDQDDINNAKACKILCQSRMEEIKFDRFVSKMDRVMFLMGHTIAEVC
jgi:CRISPR/Cas system CSM-associated protein Csm5 (group 7 of RAMP superfamily)